MKGECIMGSTALDEMSSILLGTMPSEEKTAIQEMEDILLHYGMPRRSGRYPWGSGEDPYQHGSRDFLSRVEELKKIGWTDTPLNINEEFGLITSQYRKEQSL